MWDLLGLNLVSNFEFKKWAKFQAQYEDIEDLNVNIENLVDIEDDDIIEYDDYLEAESRYDLDEVHDQKSFHVVFDDYDSLYEYSLESDYSDSALNRRQSLCSSNDYADVTTEDKVDSYWIVKNFVSKIKLKKYYI